MTNSSDQPALTAQVMGSSPTDSVIRHERASVRLYGDRLILEDQIGCHLRTLRC